jgi:uncharacterized membrane protein
MTTRPLAGAALLGFVAGLRSQVPQAALSLRGLAPARGPFKALGGRAGKTVAVLGAAGEIVADKLPVAPSRVKTGPLLGRVASGAFAGATLASAGGRRGRGLVLPALLGAAGAYAGSWGGYALRRSAAQRTNLPDPLVAVTEDAAAIGLALVATR